MLGKIFKHEFKMTSRTFIPLIIGFIIMTLLGKFSLELNLNATFDNWVAQAITTIFFIFYFIYMIAMFVITTVLIVTQFYKTMTGEQGYLTHTLPVKTITLINGKLLCAVLWELIIMIFLLFSIMIFFAGHIRIGEIQLITREISMFFSEFREFNLPLILFEIVICIVIEIFSAPLMFYASIALGHLFRKHRILGSIISYFGIYMLMQFISTISMSYFMISSVNRSLNDMASIASFYHSLMAFAIIFSAIFTVAFYVITNYIFTKKLNLE